MRKKKRISQKSRQAIARQAVKHDSNLALMTPFRESKRIPVYTLAKSAQGVSFSQWPVIICYGRRWERIYERVRGRATVSEATNE